MKESALQFLLDRNSELREQRAGLHVELATARERIAVLQDQIKYLIPLYQASAAWLRRTQRVSTSLKQIAKGVELYEAVWGGKK